MPLKGSLEDNVLTALVWSTQCTSRLLMQVTEDMFETRSYQQIARKTLEYIERYNEPPCAHIRDLFEAELRRSDDSGRLLNTVMDNMEALAESLSPQYVLQELDTFVESQNLRNTLTDALDKLQEGDLVAARESVYTIPPPQTFTVGTWLHDPDKALSFLTERDDDFFSSGIPELDNRGIRPIRGTCMCLIGPPKSGKSWFLHGVGKAALIYHHNVLHISLENSERLVAQRYIQALYAMRRSDGEHVQIPVFERDETGICIAIHRDEPVQRDEHHNIPQILNQESRYAIAGKLRGLQGRSRLLIKEFPSGSLTLGQLNAYLDTLARMEHFVPDLLVIDYPRLMAIDQRNYRLDLGRVVVGIRGIASARNLAAVIVAQSNRTGSSARVLTPAMIGEDYSAIGTCDTILTYSQGGEEKRAGLARILVAGAREAADGYLVLISQAYLIGQFCLDSMYHNEFVETELERITGKPGNEDHTGYAADE
jgi:hypothetical protein